MHMILAFVFLVLIGWGGYAFYGDYRAAKGTVWQRLLAAAEHSATILWSKFVLLIGAGTAALSELAIWLNEPSLVEPIKAVMQPQYVAYFTIFVAAVTVWARRRTASTDPIK